MSMEAQGDQPQRLLPRTIEDLLASWMRRLLGVLAVAAIACAWLSLLSWSVYDPSLTHSTSDAPRNWLGMPGALLSDILLQALGLASAFMLVPLMIGGLQLLLDEHVRKLRTRLILLAIGAPALAASFAALPASPRWLLPYGYGGVIGNFLYEITGGLVATMVPTGGGAAAGISLAILGSWALIGAMGLDRRQLFELVSFAGHASGRTAEFCLPSGSDLMQSASRAMGLDRANPVVEPNRIEPNRFEPQRFEPGTARVEPALPGMPPASKAGAVADDHDIYRNFDDADPHEIAASRMLAERFRPNAPDAAAAPRPQGHANPASQAGLPNFPAWPTSGRRGGPANEAGDGFGNGMLPPLADGPDFDHDPLPAALAQPIPGSGMREVGYRRPSLNLLNRPAAGRPADASDVHLKGMAKLLEDVLSDFRIKGEVKDIRPGPVVTLFEFEPARGIKSSRIIALADDIARSMSATSARIAVVPGRNVIGIELPNARRETVALRDLLEAPAFRSSEAKLPMALGKSIAGDPVVADLARMPHLLVAGTTGSGKSVGINAMILSLLYRLSPDDCRMIMIDPKMLELSVYNDIPHLLTPVVTDPARAVAALNWTVGEMEERYKRMAELGVRNIDIFNNRVRHAAKRGEVLGQTVHTGFHPATGQPIYEERELDLAPMPYIVVVVDEFADLMAVAGKDIEVAVQRLAQKARAAGIHLIMATQRPSVDVVTGTIKANFPTRISFKVASRIDSRTILNEQGAEQLLGQGDMLFADGAGQTQRLHGPFVSDEEVQAVAQILREHRRPDYVDGLADPVEEFDGSGSSSQGAASDAALYEQAVAMVIADQRASTSYIQRRLSIGYNRAATILERMEEAGIVSEADRAGRRQVLARASDAA